MFHLPEDVITHIFSLKHKLELKDIHEELIDNHEYKLRKIYCLHNFFLNMQLQYSEPITMIKLYTAMRNEGYMDNETYSENIEYIINLHYQTLSILPLYQMLAHDDLEILENRILCFTTILDEFDDYIDDALRQQDMSDDWLNENVR